MAYVGDHQKLSRNSLDLFLSPAHADFPVIFWSYNVDLNCMSTNFFQTSRFHIISMRVHCELKRQRGSVLRVLKHKITLSYLHDMLKFAL